MQGKDEGADKSGNDNEDDTTNGEPAEFLGRVGWLHACVLFNFGMCYACMHANYSHWLNRIESLFNLSVMICSH